MLSPLTLFTSSAFEKKDIDQLWHNASTALMLGRVSQSLYIASEIVKIDQKQQQRYWAHYRRGLELGAEFAEEVGNHYLAEYYWQSLVEYDPRDGEAWYGLAIAQANLQKYELAKQSARQGLSRIPEHIKLKQFLQYLQQLTGGLG